jgi:hypothetical protein
MKPNEVSKTEEWSIVGSATERKSQSRASVPISCSRSGKMKSL